MEITFLTSSDLEAGTTYVPAVEVSAADRIVFVSGQVPQTPANEVPADFASQCRLAWANVLSILAKAGMSRENLVKVTVFLSDRRYRDENAMIRDEVLGSHRVALTVVIVDIFEPHWLLEIEALAAA